MPTQISIPITIKTAIQNKVKNVIDEFDNDEKRMTLFQEDYHFIDDEDDAELFKNILDFANLPEVNQKATQNIRFCYPSSFAIQNNIVSARMSIQGSGGDLVDIFDDFLLSTARLLIGETDFETKFETCWQQFEADFFADEVEMVFYSQLASLYYHAGGILEDMIPKPEVSIRYLHLDKNADKALYFNLKKSLEESFRPVAPEEFSKTIPIIISYKKRVNKNERLEIHFKEASNIFEKVSFIARVVSGGSAHFDFVKPIFFGNLTSKNNLIQGYQTNHLYSQSTNSTTIENGPYETWISRLWAGIESRDIFEWQFVIQKIRDSHTRVQPDDPYYSFDDTYQLTKHLERIVDLVQALENTIGDYGFHNAEYVGKLISPTDSQRQQEIMDIIQPLYLLRDKYLHGKSTGNDSVFSIFSTTYQSKIDLLDQKIHSFEYFLQKILTFSIMNPDLKDKVLAYHQALGRRVYSQPRQRPTQRQATFPTLNTIYY